MITGRFHAVDKTGLLLPAGPGFTPVAMNDPGAGVSGYHWPLPVSDTRFTMEVSDTTFDVNDYKKRPTRFVIRLVRYRPNGSIDVTGRQQPAIVQPGTTTWGDVFFVPEYVNEDDGEFGWEVQHNAPIAVRWGSIVMAAINDDAIEIHRRGGYSMFSNGKIGPQ